ncbi:response regulator transcription factor [Paenibacillus sp. 1P07SE]|uniref:response regulator transcription factor n=1 Tax=Paenibacillus sp. 1P07SE TaxID=3132209 RepID=UPI0039A67AE1
MKQLLITDDDADIRSLLGHYMTMEGFRVLEAKNGREAMSLLKAHAVDLAITDIIMPEVDGFTLCEHIRRNYDIPIILLSAKSQLSDKVQGYLSGTDDYVTKPVEPQELLYRIKALFRRYSLASHDKIRLGRLIIDRINYEVTDGDRVLLLPMKEFELLAQLAQYPGRLFSRDELICLVWGSDYVGDERTVDVHIKRLRKRFGGHGQAGGFAILTVRGIGYKLEIMRD